MIIGIISDTHDNLGSLTKAGIAAYDTQIIQAEFMYFKTGFQYKTSKF